MKLVLCSEGFHTPNTVQACVELVGKPQDQISVAIINEGFAVEDGDKYWVLDNLNDVAKNFKGGLDIVGLLALSLDDVEARISKCDVIFVVGGNNDYLMHVFQKTGFDKLLPKLLETKVYVGSSAGSMVIGKRISTEAYSSVYGEHKTFDVQEYLNLVDFAVKPHLNSPEWPNNRAEKLAVTCAGVTFPIYALQDDSAVVINGNERKFIGAAPVKIVDGKIET
jgi:dipeptidase E